jgi:hypothetical protein
VLCDERDRPDPCQAERLERAALVSGLGHEVETRAAAGAARVWTTSVLRE